MAFPPSKVLALLFAGLLLTGCVSPRDNTPKPAENQSLNYNIAFSPRALDPQKATSFTEAEIALACFEGLTRLSREDTPEPGIAESWQSDPSGRIWTFRLRQSRWNNGDPLTAEDFLYAWRRALAPSTLSEYAPLFDSIAGAREIREGKEKDPATLGARSVDPLTLEVTLTHPDPFFPLRVAHQAFSPLHRAALEASGTPWPARPETYVGNGPFRLASWSPQEPIRLQPNPYYWDAGRVKLQNITLQLLDTPEKEQAAWAQGGLDIGRFPPAADRIEAMQQQGTLFTQQLLGNYYFEINCTRRPLHKIQVRRALGLALDRQAMAAAGTGGESPLTAWIPPGFFGKEGGGASDFRAESPTPPLPDHALEDAKNLLAEAGYPGGKGFPKISILFNAQPQHRKVAEAAAESWKALGIEVELKEKPWEEYVQSRSGGDFSVARAGWIANNRDPLPLLEAYASWSGQNRSGWRNETYDRLLEEARGTMDPARRSELLHQAERILLEEMPVIPLKTYATAFPLNPKIKDLILSPRGLKDFKYAWLSQ